MALLRQNITVYSVIPSGNVSLAFEEHGPKGTWQKDAKGLKGCQSVKAIAGSCKFRVRGGWAVWLYPQHPKDFLSFSNTNSSQRAEESRSDGLTFCLSSFVSGSIEHFKLVTNKWRNKHQHEAYRRINQFAHNPDDKETIINVSYKYEWFGCRRLWEIIRLKIALSWASDLVVLVGEWFLSLVLVTQVGERRRSSPWGESLTPSNAQSPTLMIAFRLSVTPVHRNLLSLLHQLAHKFSLWGRCTSEDEGRGLSLQLFAQLGFV